MEVDTKVVKYWYMNSKIQMWQKKSEYLQSFFLQRLTGKLPDSDDPTIFLMILDFYKSTQYAIVNPKEADKSKKPFKIKQIIIWTYIIT